MVHKLCVLMSAVILAVFLNSCGERPAKKDSYVQEIEEWRQNRFERLKSPTGWLSLAGLFWLEEGENRFGSDSANDIVFPPKAPAQLGTLTLSGETVQLQVSPGVEIRVDGAAVKEMEVYRPGLEKAIIMEHGPLSWFIIKRGTKYGVRLRDSENPKIAALNAIDAYPIDPAWRVPARLEKFDEPQKIEIENILGMVEEEVSPGKLVFEIDGTSYSLEALDGDDELFVIFRDETSGEDTYSVGRYVYVDKPADGVNTWIDFNKAYNPPCAYTDYATCPLPPLQNHLPIAITAGEKFHGEHH